MRICSGGLFVFIVLCFTSSIGFGEDFGADDNLFPIRLSVQPDQPTSRDVIVIEGRLLPSPPIQEVEIIDYSWIQENVLEVNLRFIPGDFVPPEEQNTFFSIKLDPLPEGEYYVIFKENGADIHKLFLLVDNSLPKFPVDVQFIPEEAGSAFGVKIKGEYPSTGYSILDSNIVLENNRILVSVIFEWPENPELTVIVPFEETIGKIDLDDGMYDVALEVNSALRRDYSIQVLDSKVDIIQPIPEPQPDSGPFHDARLFIDPFEINVGETVKASVAGAFSSTAYEIVKEEIVQEGDIIAIRWTVIDNEIGEDVIVPIEKIYEFSDLDPGNYVVLFQIDDQIVLESKFHVRGEVLVPSEGLPFRAELRFEIPYGGSMETGFMLVGEFPSPGYVFTEKTVEKKDDQITVSVTVEEPADPQPAVVSPYSEWIGSVEIPDLWERTYYATAVVNGIALETLPLGGALVDAPAAYPWNWIDVQVDIPSAGDSSANVYLVGEFPTPGYDFSNNTVESIDNQINIYVDVENPSDPQDQVITSFRKIVAAISDADFWLQTYDLNVFVNGELIESRKVGGENVDTAVPRWLMF
ncbi:MAG: hypothetical protein JXR73_02520 [Candidatus Omnitrophica bacterium]|nr:hypothetical protein [Candidatus Omnitrophota bacterium]